MQMEQTHTELESAEFSAQLSWEGLEWEQLSDEQSMAVRGGDLVGGLLTGVANVNNGIGNGGRPTSGALTLVGNTVVGAGTYVIGIANGAEQGLEALNATVSEAASQL